MGPYVATGSYSKVPNMMSNYHMDSREKYEESVTLEVSEASRHPDILQIRPGREEEASAWGWEGSTPCCTEHGENPW